MSKLFTPFKIGDHSLSHRVVHAPMTRLRSEPDDTPSDLMVEYYRQRASEGGLIITESSHVMRSGRGYLGGPGIYDDRHIAGWKKIADAVHAEGGKIFMQLVHDGRQSHVDLTGGTAPLAPSEVPFDGQALTQDGWVPVSMHKAATLEEIAELLAAFKAGAARALETGVDGVELHSANGYLVDTFLQDGTNRRTDAYGGSIENRARFMLEATEALVSIWGGSRVGVRFSPSGQWGSISDSNPEATFRYATEQLNRFNLAYLHVIEPRVKGVETIDEGQPPVASVFLRKIFNGPIIAAGGFDLAGAEHTLNQGDADLVAFGRYFASNPDLPERLRNKLPLAPYDRSAFWGGTDKGYVDYPTYEESLALQA